MPTSIRSLSLPKPSTLAGKASSPCDATSNQSACSSQPSRTRNLGNPHKTENRVPVGLSSCSSGFADEPRHSSSPDERELIPTDPGIARRQRLKQPRNSENASLHHSKQTLIPDSSLTQLALNPVRRFAISTDLNPFDGRLINGNMR
jgi:hypothetical protein